MLDLINNHRYTFFFNAQSIKHVILIARILVLTKQTKDQGDKKSTPTHTHTHKGIQCNKERIICYLLYTNNVFLSILFQSLLISVFFLSFRLHFKDNKKNCKIYWSLQKIAQAKRMFVFFLLLARILYVLLLHY